MDLNDIEAKLNKIKEIKEVEHALAVLESGVKNGALIHTIGAEDAAEAERSLKFSFNADETKAIFAAAAMALMARHNELETAVGYKNDFVCVYDGVGL